MLDKTLINMSHNIKNSILFSSIALIIIIYSNGTIACSYIRTIPIKADSMEYVFSGRVIGICGPMTVADITNTHYPFHATDINYIDILVGKAYGLIVAVEEIVNWPGSQVDTVEILQYSTNADCSPIPIDSTKLAKFDYSQPGTKVLVYAKLSRYFDKRAPNTKLRLECWTLKGTGITNENLNHNFNVLEDYILRVELFRLERAENISKKIDIIRKIKQDDIYGPSKFLEMMRIHLGSEEIIRRALKY